MPTEPCRRPHEGSRAAFCSSVISRLPPDVKDHRVPHRDWARCTPLAPGERLVSVWMMVCNSRSRAHRSSVSRRARRLVAITLFLAMASTLRRRLPVQSVAAAAARITEFNPESYTSRLPGEKGWG